MDHEVVLITGASAGVGRATAREFARHGAWVGLLARDRSRLERAAAEVEAFGGRAVVCVGDVADPQQVAAAAQLVEQTLGPIDVWINNAMASIFCPIRDLRPEEIRRVTEVTYLGAVHGTLVALERMLPRNRGVIVQVGSALAQRSIPLQSAYCAAKHALAGFTESLRCERIHDRSEVRVTEVHLPAVNTPQFTWVRNRMPNQPRPPEPIYQPEVAARAIHWAAHHRRRQILVGGPTLIAVAADKLAPALADRYLGKTGYESQQSEVSASGDRPDNLFHTVPGNFGAHGEFGDVATHRSLELWLTQRRNSILAALGAGAALWLAWRLAARRLTR
ncbi:MAG TPA: SDR family oxidoreductase [Thermoanaerobaculia bacterium]|nr:SDR family oxidoreductase [Thermoanaerobaculia bacterium]